MRIANTRKVNDDSDNTDNKTTIANNDDGQ